MQENGSRSQSDSVAAEVRRVKRGDAEAREALARRAARLALRTSAALMRNREEAADVAQDVAVDVLASLDKLRDPNAFDAWVHRITARHAFRRLNRKRRASRFDVPLALLPDSEHPAAGSAVDRDAVLAARTALAVALVRLPPKQRIALVLRYVHDLSDQEIADALGCRTGSVHALLSRGRKTLSFDPRLAELAVAFNGG
jgi:RNA polymerase sigma-70 factor (ECF subfamily)